MRRSILFSLMVIGAVIAVVAGASTFSAFTSSDSISGTVTAGKLKVDLDQTSGTEIDTTFTLGNGTDCDTGEMAPGDDCVVNLTVQNENPSNLEFTYVLDVAKTGDISPSCFTLKIDTVTHSVGTDVTSTTIAGPADAVQIKHLENSIGGDTTDALDPNDSDSFNLHVAIPVTETRDACQGVALTITASVVATQSTTPHD
jgi:predicted ribosomally synthesized peptide with SipW-like signal peptide